MRDGYPLNRRCEVPRVEIRVTAKRRPMPSPSTYPDRSLISKRTQTLRS